MDTLQVIVWVWLVVAALTAAIRLLELRRARSTWHVRRVTVRDWGAEVLCALAWPLILLVAACEAVRDAVAGVRR
jgi:predicted membrane-bound spermidine synthase